MNIEASLVSIVGAGPGDPELISVKGLKVLQRADCVLYDFLSAPELLTECKPSAEKICVGKADGLHLKEQREINRLLYEKSLLFKRVVRLKGGDPFIFSRGADEVRYLLRKKVRVEIVPGITSALSGPESAGIPLTVKGRISSVAILTGRKKDADAEIDAPDCQTLVYLMGVSNISNIVKALKKGGRPENEPCAFIEKATKADQRVIFGTIKTIVSKAQRHKVTAPAVFIVGEAIKKRIKCKNGRD